MKAKHASPTALNCFQGHFSFHVCVHSNEIVLKSKQSQSKDNQFFLGDDAFHAKKPTRLGTS